MRISFKKACEIIYKYFSRENVEQIWKPDGKNYYIVSVKERPTMHIYREQLLQMTTRSRLIDFKYAP